MFCCAWGLCRALWEEFSSFGGTGSNRVLRGDNVDLQLQGVIPGLVEEIGHFWMREGFYSKSALQAPGELSPHCSTAFASLLLLHYDLAHHIHVLPALSLLQAVRGVC